MTPLITKQQVKKWNRKLPENIADGEIDGYILDAQEYDVISVLPDSLLNAITVQILARIKQWDRVKAYAIGEAVWFGSERKFYKALIANTDSQPPTANWGDFELMNFHENYLQPYIAYAAFYRFIAEHGKNITQFGYTSPVDPQGTFQPVSSQDRAATLGDINNKKEMWTLKISKKLNEVDYTFDTVVYESSDNEGCESSRLKIVPKIFQLGGRRNSHSHKWHD